VYVPPGDPHGWQGGEPDKPGVDLGLWDGVAVAGLPDVDPERPGRDELEDAPADEPVVDDGVGRLDQPAPPDGDQLGVA